MGKDEDVSKHEYLPEVVGLSDWQAKTDKADGESVE